MPRKVRSAPPITAIQSLSTGKRLDLIDDFNQQPIPHKAAGPLPSSEDILRAKRKAEVDEQLLMLQLLGLAEGTPRAMPRPEPRAIAPEIEGMRPIGKLGDNRAIYIPADPIRRGR